MTRILILLLVAGLSGTPIFAQKSKGKKGPKTGGSFFSKLERKYAKYYATLGVGRGKSSWNSELGSTLIYDLSGASYASGNLKFKTIGIYDSYYIEASMPVSNFRFGMGINFQYHYIDKLELFMATGNKVILYSESFRFDKIYLNYEIPFNARTEKPWAFSVKGNIGYFGLSYVDHQNFFGEEALAKTWFFTLGIVPDVKLYPHTYLFLYPNVEYTFFDNAKSENPSEIKHNILQWSISGGIRVDMSKE